MVDTGKGLDVKKLFAFQSSEEQREGSGFLALGVRIGFLCKKARDFMNLNQEV
jgi:hypothetical protein